MAVLSNASHKNALKHFEECLFFRNFVDLLRDDTHRRIFSTLTPLYKSAILRYSNQPIITDPQNPTQGQSQRNCPQVIAGYQVKMKIYFVLVARTFALAACFFLRVFSISTSSRLLLTLASIKSFAIRIMSFFDERLFWYSAKVRKRRTLNTQQQREYTLASNHSFVM